MQIFHTLKNTDNLPLALTIGNFDGVHKGHQEILSVVMEKAAEQRITPAVMTFSPHAKVFLGNIQNFLITSDAEKSQLIAACGIQRLYQIPFTKEFSTLEPELFIRHLIDDLNVQYVLIGDDFRFGHHGRGDFQLLREVCQKNAIGVANTPTISYNEKRVSSSRVRKLIEMSDFSTVQQLLGRELSYQSEVIYGNRLGRTIGFPTANIKLSRARLLPRGVFVVKVAVTGNDMMYYGMCNIGTKPTVDNSETRQIETHIFDFSGDLYGKTIEVTPMQKIRNEEKFTSVDELVMQLHRDKQAALKIIALTEY